MNASADPTDPRELRRQFPELASLAGFDKTTFTLAEVLDAVRRGGRVVTSYRDRPVDLRVPDGQRVLDVATEIGDEAIEAIVTRLFAPADEVDR